MEARRRGNRKRTPGPPEPGSPPCSEGAGRPGKAWRQGYSYEVGWGSPLGKALKLLKQTIFEVWELNCLKRLFFFFFKLSFYYLWNLFPWKPVAAQIWQHSGQWAFEFVLFLFSLLKLGPVRTQVIASLGKGAYQPLLELLCCRIPRLTELPQTGTTRMQDWTHKNIKHKNKPKQTKNQKHLPKAENKWEHFIPLKL